jgi:hypothetical protein
MSCTKMKANEATVIMLIETEGYKSMQQEIKFRGPLEISLLRPRPRLTSLSVLYTAWLYIDGIQQNVLKSDKIEDIQG